MSAAGWATVRASLRSLDDVRAFRIGEHEWYTAVVRWCLAGMAYFGDGEFSAGSAGSSWTTSVLFTPDVADPRVTILRHGHPLPLSSEEFTSLGLTTPVVSLGPLAEAMADFFRALGPTFRWDAMRGLPRAYEGALKRQARQSAIERRLLKIHNLTDDAHELPLLWHGWRRFPSMAPPSPACSAQAPAGGASRSPPTRWAARGSAPRRNW